MDFEDFKRMPIADRYDLVKMAEAAKAANQNVAHTYKEWLALGLSMAGGGERLLQPFLDLCEQSENYNEHDSRRLFKHRLTLSKDEDLAYFLKVCRERCGLKIKDFLRPEIVENVNGPAAVKWVKGPDGVKWVKGPDGVKEVKEVKEMDVLDSEWVSRCRSDRSVFMEALVRCEILTDEQARRAAETYRLGATKARGVIFWQIDDQERVRDGKVMFYMADCHRDKKNHPTWVSHTLKRQRDATGIPLLPDSWSSTHCLFGLHLLPRVKAPEPGQPPLAIAIVEAEKTAVICSERMRDKPFVWMATGGLSELKVEKLRPLKGCRVVLFPDTDTDGSTYASWCLVAHQVHAECGIDVQCSAFLEQHASAEQKQRKIDIADWLLEAATSEHTRTTLASASPELQAMMDESPEMRALVETFGLVETGER